MSRRGGGCSRSPSVRAKKSPIVDYPIREAGETEPARRKQSDANGTDSSSSSSEISNGDGGVSEASEEGRPSSASGETATARGRRPRTRRRTSNPSSGFPHSPIDEQEEDEPNFWRIYEQIMTATNVKLKSFRWILLRPWVKIVLFTVCLCITLAPLLLRNLNAHDREQQLALRLKHFSRDADELADSITAGDSQRRRTAKSMLRYAGEVLIGRRLRRPAVFLIAARREETIDLLLRGLRSLFTKHALHYTEVDLLSRPGVDRGRLEELVSERMEINTALALIGIDRLQSNSPLVLHSLSDPETSPYLDWNVLLIATVRLEDVSKFDADNCNSRIIEHLLGRWREGLSDDKIYPIISRLSAIVICLD